MSVVPAPRYRLPAPRTAPLRASWTVLLPSKRQAPVLSLAIAGLVAANLVLYVITVVQEAGGNRTQTEILQQRQENVRLRAHLAAAENPDRVAYRATTELQMTQPERSLFFPAPPAAPGPGAPVEPPAFGAPEAF